MITTIGTAIAEILAFLSSALQAAWIACKPIIMEGITKLATKACDTLIADLLEMIPA